MQRVGSCGYANDPDLSIAIMYMWKYESSRNMYSYNVSSEINKLYIIKVWKINHSFMRCGRLRNRRWQDEVYLVRKATVFFLLVCHCYNQSRDQIQYKKMLEVFASHREAIPKPGRDGISNKLIQSPTNSSLVWGNQHFHEQIVKQNIYFVVTSWFFLYKNNQMK